MLTNQGGFCLFNHCTLPAKRVFSPTTFEYLAVSAMSDRLWLCTVSSIQCRPGSSSVLHWCLHKFSVWCASRHCNLDSFLIHTNMLSSSQGWKNHHSILTILSLISQYRNSVSFRSSSKASLHVDLSIMQNAISRLPIESSTALSLLSMISKSFYSIWVRLSTSSTTTSCWKYFTTDSRSLIFHLRPGHDVKLYPHRVMSRAWR